MNDKNRSVLMGRYYSPRDMRLMQSINDELSNKIIQTFIQLYRINLKFTNTNIYGESDTSVGKIYDPGVLISCLIIHPETTTKQEGAGNDCSKTGMIFNLNELFCRKANIYPNTGDIIAWNNVYFEIDNISQEQHLGGQFEKSFSISCNAHQTKLSSLNLIVPTKDG